MVKMMNLFKHLGPHEKRKLLKLLSAAGEMLKDELAVESPEQISLMNLCRVAIREHLLEVDVHVNVI